METQAQAFRRVIVLGRHNQEDLTALGLEVVPLPPELANISWPLNLNECLKKVDEVAQTAAKLNADVLLQNTPGILTAALVFLGMQYAWTVRFGVMVSYQDKEMRKSGATKTVRVFGEYYNEARVRANEFVEAIKFANARAKCEVSEASGDLNDCWCDVTITVDPISEFKLDHIEWL